MGKYWLFKSEPDVFSFADLAASPGKTAPWDGVRNFQARNFLRDEVKPGDQVLFYHSRIQPPCIVGIAEVVREAYPDPTAWDPTSPYSDSRSTPEKPLWYAVDVRWTREFASPVTLPMLKSDPALEELLVIRKGMRLSIQPVSEQHFQRIMEINSFILLLSV